MHAVADHIACDANSNSELVVPIVTDGFVWGVLDIDSPQHARFSQEDQAGIEALVATFMRQTDLPRFPLIQGRFDSRPGKSARTKSPAH
ncbi:hypothetical protein HAALTHF_34900n [Vreelandella aquamarina]|nr:hypothetical protein HAALTHF_34900n [Halomonas axialensis]